MELIPLCTLDATIGGMHLIGTGPAGARTIAEVSGGSVTGERLNGTVKGNAAADWMRTSKDGIASLDVRVVVEVRVDRRDEARDLRPHAALARERHVLAAVLDEPLEERLREAGTRRLLARDHRAELAVVPHEHELLGAEDDGDEALWLGGLRGLIDEALAEAQHRDARVARRAARAAHHVRRL